MRSLYTIITIMTMSSAIISTAIKITAPIAQRSTQQSLSPRLPDLPLGPYQGCPAPLSSCPIFSNPKSINLNISLSRRNFRRSWECLNLRTDVNSCGSCETDCMDIPKVKDVKCQSGSCKIISCQLGSQPQLVVDVETGRKKMGCI